MNSEHPEDCILMDTLMAFSARSEDFFVITACDGSSAQCNGQRHVSAEGRMRAFTPLHSTTSGGFPSELRLWDVLDDQQAVDVGMEGIRLATTLVDI